MQPANKPGVEPETIDQIQQRLTVMWGALLMSQSFFLLVLYFGKRELFVLDLSAPVGGSNPVLVAMLAVLAMTSFTLSFILRKRMVFQAEAEQDPSLVQTGLVIGCAFCESISILGFLLAFLIDYRYFFVWFALGLVGIILHFPRKNDLLRATYRKSDMTEQAEEI
jgi:F0F1-type ATP synthase membrane subunit c/vacuolar-type H+-ATPase subunit K